MTDQKLQEVELTPEQRKRALELFRSTDGVFHDLALACQNVIALRDQLEQALKDTARLDSKTIRIEGRDEFGHPSACIHIGINLRDAIDAAIKERS